MIGNYIEMILTIFLRYLKFIQIFLEFLDNIQWEHQKICTFSKGNLQLIIGTKIANNKMHPVDF